MKKVNIPSCGSRFAMESLAMDKNLLLSKLLTLCFLMAAQAIDVSPVNAQGRGNRGGGPGGPTSLRGELRREEVQQELGLSEDQIAKIRELPQLPDSGFPQFGRGGFGGRGGEQSAEDRAKMMAEMRAAMEKSDMAYEEQVKPILTPEQLARLKQIVLHKMGPTALLRTTGPGGVELSAEQKSNLEKVQEEYSNARRELGFGGSREEMDKLRATYDAKMMAVLTPTQQGAWQKAIGPAPVESINTPRPASGQPTTATPTPRSAPVAIRSEVANQLPPEDFDPNAKFSFSFKAAAWEDVLVWFAARAGLTLDSNEVPPGTFNYLDKREYTASEALDVLNGYLLPKGYVLVHRDRFLVCINIDSGIPPNVIPYIKVSELEKRGLNELLTVVFPVIKGVETEALSRQVSELLGPQGKSVGLAAASSLVVTDIGANLRRVQELLTAMSALQGPDDLTFQGYAIKHIRVEDAESLVRNVLGMNLGVKNVSSNTEQRSRESSSRGSDANISANQLSKTQLTSEPRTNKLLVTAPAAVHKLVENALAIIDVELEEGGVGGVSKNKKYLVVYQLTSTDAGEVAKSLDVLMPGVVVNDDRSSKKLHLFANEAQHREAETLIRQFDGQGAGQAVTVINLSSMDPLSAAGTLRALFFADGVKAPTIETDLLGRRLMIRGTADQLTQIKALLLQLGEDGTGKRTASGEGNVRRVPLAGRNVDQILGVIEESWKASHAKPIRIIPATPKSPPRTIRRQAEPVEEGASLRRPTNEEPKGDEPARKSPSVMRNDRLNVHPTAFPNDTPKKTVVVRPVADTPDVTIKIMDGELVLISPDTAALDNLEAVLKDAMRVIPPETSWVVFSLQAADAAEAAKMLQQLIPNTTVSKTSTSTGGMADMMGLGAIGQMGSNLVSAAGIDQFGQSSQTLKIIPDARLNALYVSGPRDKVDEVQRLLEVVDLAGFPDTLRDRIPTMIPVVNAEIADVYRMVKDVFKDSIEPSPQGGANGAPNMMAMMMGGGGGRGGNGQQVPTEVKMTVSMDDQTSHLIVSADAGLTEEVRQLVESLDKVAGEARKTIRTVKLRNATPSTIQGTLGNLYPKVKVSSSGRRKSNETASTSNNSASTPSASGASATTPNPDMIRQMFESRSRSSNSPFGGGFPSGAPPSFGGSSPFGSGSSRGFSPFGGGSRGGSDSGGRGGR